MKKSELTQLGISYCKKFCKLNNIPEPKFIINSNRYNYNCGTYIQNKIYINESKCANETKTPGFSWSHRHYFVDREPCGVVCHEFGHYIHDFLTKFKLQFPKENPISGYEPNHKERFAEAFKVFILNPDLLKNYAPKKYEIFTKTLKLIPIFSESWKEVLEKSGAHEKFIKSAENKIKKSIK